MTHARAGSITLSWMVGFLKYLAHIIIRTRKGVLYKNHIDSSKFKVSVCTLTLCIGFSENLFVRP